MIFTCGAILFDLDGVLVDSTSAVERVWRKWALEHHLDPQHVIEHAHGRRSIETIQMVAPELDAAQENLRVERMEIGDKEGVIALPGASELMRYLPKGRFAIVTSATRELAEARLRYADLPAPERLITADDVSSGKPSPEPYLMGAALLGIVPADCLVIEDTPAGVQSARSAGMQVVALSTTYPAHELKAADAVVDSLAEINAKFANGVIEVQSK